MTIQLHMFIYTVCTDKYCIISYFIFLSLICSVVGSYEICTCSVYGCISIEFSSKFSYFFKSFKWLLNLRFQRKEEVLTLVQKIKIIHHNVCMIDN